MRQASAFGRWRNCAIGCVIVAIMLAPLYWVVVTSLETDSEIFNIPVKLWPASLHWSTFSTVFTEQWHNVVTSLVVSVGTVALTLLIATPTGYALARFRIRGFYLATIVLLIVQMIPSIVMASVLFVIFDRIGLVNTVAGLVLADSTASIPFAILLLRVFMMAIPAGLVEASLIDGANEWQAFVRIVLPLSKAGLITVSLFSFLFAWGNFIYALVLIQTPSRSPVTLTIYQYLTVHGDSWSKVMALATIEFLPIGVILVAGQRYIRGGILTGALTG